MDIISGRVLDIFGATSDAMIALDAMWRIVAWNAAATELFGCTANEVLGRHCADVLRWRDRHGNLVYGPHGPVGHGVAQEPIGLTKDMLAPTPSGQLLWLSVSTLELPSVHHEVCRLVHFAREVTLTPGQILALGPEPARATGEVSASDGLRRLTHREAEVLDLLARGIGTAEVAARLGLSTTTIRNHVARILAKLEVHSRLEATALAKCLR
jgi:PAS domain S-box-containing protein